MNDGWLFLGIIGFLFLLWVYSGGPNHPISFAGPYITPISGSSLSLVDASSTISSANTGTSGMHSSGTNEGGVSSTGVSNSRRSAVYHQVLITSIARGTTPNTETVSLQSQGVNTIDITGWKLKRTSTNATFTIPRGTTLPHQNGSGTLSDIILAANGNAVVTSGYSPAGQSYLENECTDYITSSTYERCVFDHEGESGFTGTLWDIYLFQNHTLWAQSDDTVELLDQSGHVVDQYTY